MRIELEEKTHTYSVNGNIASISVTELLAKHGLAPNYNRVNKRLLKESADKGKEIHKDLEYILNVAEYEPETEQGKHFKEWVNKNLDCGIGEQKLAYEYEGMIIAGTADVMGILKDGTFFVGDHKNTLKFHREYVSWQVSLLDYFARKLGAEKVNGKFLNWKGASKFMCFHYDPNTFEMKVYDIDKIDDCEIEKLIQCEYKNEIYQRPLLVIDNELQVQFLEAERVLKQIENEKSQAEQRAKLLREQLCVLFKEQGIKSWESPNKEVKVTFIDAIDKITVDSKRLKEKYPKIYEDCNKLTKVKESVRVTIRKGDGEDEWY